MHPVDRKKKYFNIVVVCLALLISTTCILLNPAYAIIPAAYLFFAIEKRKKVRSLLSLTAVYIIAANLAILFFDNVLFKLFFTEPFQAPIRFILSLASFFVLFSFHYLGKYNNEFQDVIDTEKKNYSIIQKYPNLLCTKHHTKTKQVKILGFKIIHCRKSWFCLGMKRVREVKEYIGLIGKDNERWTPEKKYYSTLWDNRSKKIKDGDYDVIEIYENPQISDYDGIINKIISVFYNELNRFKPIDEVVVRIYGNPKLSVSTKRLLEERFLRVEFIETSNGNEITV